MRWPIRIALAIVIVFLVLLLVGPFLIPVRPLRGLVPAERLADVTVASSNCRSAAPAYTSTTRSWAAANATSCCSTASAPAVFVARGHGGPRPGCPRRRLRPTAFGLTERPMRENWGSAGDWEAHNPYSLQAQVDLTIRLLDQLGIQRAVLVGNSAGGTVAMLPAPASGARGGPVLLDPAVYAGERGGGLRWLLRRRRLGTSVLSSRAQSAPGAGTSPAPPGTPGAHHRRNLGRLRKPLQVEYSDRAALGGTRAAAPSDLLHTLRN